MQPDERARVPRPTNLAEVLRLYRVVGKVSTRLLAHNIGISAATMNRIEHGRAMDAETLLKVLNWLMR